MAELFSRYTSGLQFTAGTINGSANGVSGLNAIVDRLNSIAPNGSQISGTNLTIYGNDATFTGNVGILNNLSGASLNIRNNVTDSEYLRLQSNSLSSPTDEGLIQYVSSSGALYYSDGTEYQTLTKNSNVNYTLGKYAENRNVWNTRTFPHGMGRAPIGVMVSMAVPHPNVSYGETGEIWFLVGSPMGDSTNYKIDIVNTYNTSEGVADQLTGSISIMGFFP